MSTWDTRFEELLRAVLPDLPADAEITPELDLRQSGLTSLGIIELMVRIEDAYGRPVPDERLRPRTFATAASLWDAVHDLHQG